MTTIPTQRIFAHNIITCSEYDRFEENLIRQDGLTHNVFQYFTQRLVNEGFTLDSAVTSLAIAYLYRVAYQTDFHKLTFTQQGKVTADGFVIANNGLSILGTSRCLLARWYNFTVSTFPGVLLSVSTVKETIHPFLFDVFMCIAQVFQSLPFPDSLTFINRDQFEKQTALHEDFRI